jgi:ABC-type polar amino acid transport system ATPase subunit
LYGSTEVIDEIADDIAEYSISSEETVWALAIKGASGSGKSLFVRCLLIEVIKKQAQILANKNK